MPYVTSCTAPLVYSNTLALEDIFIKLLKKNSNFRQKQSSSPLAASCGSWFSRDGVSMAAAPNSVVSLAPKVLEKCELTIRQCSDENGSAYLILSQSGWCFHNVDICWHISMRCLLQDAWVMPTIRICKMMFLTAAQNRCINSMPKMAHAPDKFRTPEEQVLKNSCLFKVIRSASLFQLPSLLHRL